MTEPRFDLTRLIQRGRYDGEVHAYVRHRLEPLLDSDAEHDSQLVPALRAYLGSCGNYLRTARTLDINPSTARYRVHRIRQVLADDLTDRDIRFNLQAATHLLA